SAVLDFHPSRLNPELVGEAPANSGLNSAPWQRQAVAVRVDSDGGRIELSGSQFLYADSTLLAKAGGETALGGTLSVSSGRFYASGESRTGADTNLFVAASGQASRIASTSTLSNISSGLLASSTPDAYLASIQRPARQLNAGRLPCLHTPISHDRFSRRWVLCHGSLHQRRIRLPRPRLQILQRRLADPLRRQFRIS
ncbi:MAG: hypothetical protein NTZ94_17085, partial [Verrucomicrobia bacterium]|nr:hypothetical protein [Verrucomicrobiota bacterium]